MATKYLPSTFSRKNITHILTPLTPVYTGPVNTDDYQVVILSGVVLRGVSHLTLHLSGWVEGWKKAR